VARRARPSPRTITSPARFDRIALDSKVAAAAAAAFFVPQTPSWEARTRRIMAVAATTDSNAAGAVLSPKGPDVRPPGSKKPPTDAGIGKSCCWNATRADNLRQNPQNAQKVSRCQSFLLHCNGTSFQIGATFRNVVAVGYRLSLGGLEVGLFFLM
jgi:hypothetical protein